MMDVSISLWIWLPILVITSCYTYISRIGDSQYSTTQIFFRTLCFISGFAFLVSVIIGFIVQHISIK